MQFQCQLWLKQVCVHNTFVWCCSCSLLYYMCLDTTWRSNGGVPLCQQKLHYRKPCLLTYAPPSWPWWTRTLCFPHTTLINSHEGHNHDDDHTGHDHDDDHTGHDHSGHDHSGHDHSGHGHEAVTDGVKVSEIGWTYPRRRYVYTVDGFILWVLIFMNLTKMTHSWGSKFVAILFSFIIHTENHKFVGIVIRGSDPPRKPGKLVPHEN